MKLALIGTGKIVHDALSALKAVPSVETAAIYGRPHSADTAGALAAGYHIPEVYTDYSELLSRTAADTVYIGLINSVHYSFAKEALLAGKNVILEKPFTARYREAADLKTLASERGLFLFEAATVLHNEPLRRMRENLPTVGRVRLITAAFSQYSSRYDAYRQGKVDPMLDPACCGGTLYDLNVYNLYYCIALFGRPLSVSYHPNLGFNGIDTSGVLLLTYDGFQAVCTAAKDSDGPSFFSIQGEDGTVYLDGKPNIASRLTVTKRGSAASQVIDAAAMPHRMTREWMDFADILARGDHTACENLMDITENVMWVLDTAREQAGIRFN